MTLAFVCAMPMELRPLSRRLSLRRTTLGGVDVHAGTPGGRAVVAMVTGMGTALARAGTEALLDAVPVEQVVVVGITGAIENDTPLGTLVVPEAVVNSATGESFTPAPILDVTPTGTMWTTDVLVTDADVLTGLRAKGVVSLDMETAAIAEVCERRDVPWSVVRAISDRAGDGSVDEEILGLSSQDGTPNPTAIARYVLRHPGRIRHLARLGKGANVARNAAADAAIRACGLG